MFFLAFLNTIKIILENSILKYGLKRKGTSRFFRLFLGLVKNVAHVRPWSKMGPKLKSAPKTECQNLVSRRATHYYRNDSAAHFVRGRAHSVGKSKSDEKLPSYANYMVAR